MKPKKSIILLIFGTTSVTLIPCIIISQSPINSLVQINAYILCSFIIIFRHVRRYYIASMFMFAVQVIGALFIMHSLQLWPFNRERRKYLPPKESLPEFFENRCQYFSSTYNKYTGKNFVVVRPPDSSKFNYIMLDRVKIPTAFLTGLTLEDIYEIHKHYHENAEEYLKKSYANNRKKEIKKMERMKMKKEEKDNAHNNFLLKIKKIFYKYIDMLGDSKVIVN